MTPLLCALSLAGLAACGGGSGGAQSKAFENQVSAADDESEVATHAGTILAARASATSTADTDAMMRKAEWLARVDQMMAMAPAPTPLSVSSDRPPGAIAEPVSAAAIPAVVVAMMPAAPAPASVMPPAPAAAMVQVSAQVTAPAPSPAPVTSPPPVAAPAPASAAASAAPAPAERGGPAVDAKKLAAVQRTEGFSSVRVQPTAEIAEAGDGNFRTWCTFSHMSYDDPIVYPGQPGRAHLHTFFGNTGADAYSTAQSIRSSGNSTCRGGIVNRSAYWVPTMIDTRSGSPIVPEGAGIYYKHGYVDASTVQPMPAGLRMIAGDAAASGESTGLWPTYRFKCVGGPNNSNDKYGSVIPNCDAGAYVFSEIFFPTCWDGKNLDSPDHKSHMSYYIQAPAGGFRCPTSHPIPLPQITFNVTYIVPATNAATHWRLSSDSYDPSKPAGYSSHADWFNGWDAEVSDAWAAKCVRAKKECHSHLLGDGRQIY